MSDGATKRKRVRWLQRYLLNPPAKAATWAGLVPGYVIVESRGRKTGKLRHNVVGMRVEGDTGWVVAEHGRHRRGGGRRQRPHPAARLRPRAREGAADHGHRPRDRALHLHMTDLSVRSEPFPVDIDTCVDPDNYYPRITKRP